MRLVSGLLIWVVAAVIFLLTPIAMVAAAFAWGHGQKFPLAGHPYLTYVEISTYDGRWIGHNDYANVSILYVSPRAKRAMQELADTRLLAEQHWPKVWHDRRRFPMVDAYICFSYPFRWERGARARIYRLQDGFFILLYHHSDALPEAYYVHGKRADIYRRLFKPLFSKGPLSGYGTGASHFSF